MGYHRLLLGLTAVAASWLLLPGVGADPSLAAPPGPGEAVFVGRSVCVTCHSDVDEEFSQQAHGQNFRNHDGQDLVGASGNTSCTPCHTTGFGEPSGFDSEGAPAHLEGIGCEECHGPGSAHAASPSASVIPVPPNSQETCGDCHVPRYKMLRGSVGAVTDADLLDTAPGRIMMRYPAALLMLGKYGYNRTAEPGPHRWGTTCTGCHLNLIATPESTWRDESGPTSTSRPWSEEGTLDHGRNSLAADLTTCARCHETGAAALGKFKAFRGRVNGLLVELGGKDPLGRGEPDRKARGGLLGRFAMANGIDLQNNSAPDDPAVKAYKGARHDYMFVLADGGRGVHDPEFAEQLLKDAKALLEGARESGGES